MNLILNYKEHREDVLKKNRVYKTVNDEQTPPLF